VSKTPVSPLSQSATLNIPDDSDLKTTIEKLNGYLELLRSDIQQLAGQFTSKNTTYLSGSGGSLLCTATGIGSLTAHASTGQVSTVSDYSTIRLLRNGVNANNVVNDSRETPIPAFLGGISLGVIAVTIGDVLSLSIVTTGSPTPTLTASNFSLLLTLREV